GQPERAACRASLAAGYCGAAGRSFRTSAEIAAQASGPHCLTIVSQMIHGPLLVELCILRCASADPRLPGSQDPVVLPAVSLRPAGGRLTSFRLAGAGSAAAA